jgi:hypothetical protein
MVRQGINRAGMKGGYLMGSSNGLSQAAEIGSDISGERQSIAIQRTYQRNAVIIPSRVTTVIQ